MQAVAFTTGVIVGHQLLGANKNKTTKTTSKSTTTKTTSLPAGFCLTNAQCGVLQRCDRGVCRSVCSIM